MAFPPQAFGVRHILPGCGGVHAQDACADENADGFYEKLGMTKAQDVMEYNPIEWTGFTAA